MIDYRLERKANVIISDIINELINELITEIERLETIAEKQTEEIDSLKVQIEDSLEIIYDLNNTIKQLNN